MVLAYKKTLRYLEFCELNFSFMFKELLQDDFNFLFITPFNKVSISSSPSGVEDLVLVGIKRDFPLIDNSPSLK
jgi:hypothetical protein